MNDLLSTSLLDNSLASWAVALVLTLVSLGLLLGVKRMAAARITRFAQSTATPWDDVAADLLTRTHGLFLLVLALLVGAMGLHLPDAQRVNLFTLAAVALILQGGVWANALLLSWLQRDHTRRKEQDRASLAVMNAVGFMGRVVLWSLVALLVLDNLGMDVTTLVAGLGVGGVAVALAVQNLLGDLFASLTIALDKPFTTGDFLMVGDLLGSVEHIGLKTTRLRSLSGEQLVFSNTDLLGSRIRNYGRMYERRVVFKIAVTYQTPREQLRRIPGMIRAAVEAQDGVRFDRAHFQRFGDFSLDFENVYYVLSPDYNLYMDIQQAINLGIHEAFEREGIEFAYPTQTLFLARR